MVITVQITPDGKATEMTSEEADEQKRGAYIQRRVAERAGTLGASPPVQTDNDHARHLRLRRGRYERPGYDHLSPPAVGELHARGHHLRDGVYRQRERRRGHRLYKGRPDVYLQAGIKTPNSKIT